MRADTPDRDPIFASVALLCLPAAFQLAAAATVPENLWPILVLSIWATLTAGALLLAGLARLFTKALARRRAAARTRWFRTPRRLVKPSWQ